MEYGLLGVSVERSLSPALHRHFGDYEYSLCSVSRDEFCRIMSEKNFRGVNVTMPYKIDAFRLCDETSETAKRTGCVNTVINRNGRLFGDNTDFFGMKYMLGRAGISLRGKRVAILGGGGTFLTARAVCETEGAAEIFRISRSGNKSYDELYELSADVLINTTPVGMSPDVFSCPADISRMKNLSAVADVVYTPLKTELILRAEEAGKKTASGLVMLAAQAKKSAELFAGEPIDDSLIEKAYSDILGKTANIVLTGMAGCGKTTVGRLLSEMLARPFYDTDEMIERSENMTIPEIFARFGEARFRELERKTIESIADVRESVISVGGGAVLSEENRRNLCRNGRIVYIKREPADLATAGRPLSQSPAEAETLFSARKPIYEAFCDVTVENAGTPRETAEKTVKELFL